MRARRLTIQQRQQVFHEVVATQDSHLMSVSDSYRHVGEQFGLSEDQVRQIADEGLEKQWPPLDETVEEISGAMA